MFYFTCSLEHKTFHFFTGLNNKDKYTFGMASLQKTVDITEILLKVALNTINQKYKQLNNK
jgi:hypothetical protein